MNNEEPQGGSTAVAPAPEQSPANPLNPMDPIGTPDQPSLNATHQARQEQKGIFSKIAGVFSKASPVQVSFENKSTGNYAGLSDKDALAVGTANAEPNLNSLSSPQPGVAATESAPSQTPEPAMPSLPETPAAPPAAESTIGNTPPPVVEPSPSGMPPHLEGGMTPPVPNVTPEAQAAVDAQPATTGETNTPLTQNMENAGEHPAEIPTAETGATAQIPTTEPSEPAPLTPPDASTTPMSSGEVSPPKSQSETTPISTEPAQNALQTDGSYPGMTATPKAPEEVPVDPLVPPGVTGTESAPNAANPLTGMEQKPTENASETPPDPLAIPEESDEKGASEVVSPPAFSTEALNKPATEAEKSEDPSSPLPLESNMPPKAEEDTNKWMVPPAQSEQPAAPATVEPEATVTEDPLAVPTSLSQDMESKNENPSTIPVAPEATAQIPTFEPESTAGLPKPSEATTPMSSGEIVPPAAQPDVLAQATDAAANAGASDLTGAQAPMTENPVASAAEIVASNAGSNDLSGAQAPSIENLTIPGMPSSPTPEAPASGSTLGGTTETTNPEQPATVGGGTQTT